MVKAMKKGRVIWYLECKKPDRSGSITAVARELVRYKLDLAGVQGVQWGHGKCRRLKFFSMEIGTTFINWELDCLYIIE
jgi:hypothetical protein